MVHYECHVCGITATCVVTPAAELAWLDHMATHSASTSFSQWWWEAVQIPFGD